MTLLERRKIKELEDVTLPGRVKEIEEICGAAIPYEVEWETFSGDLDGLNYLDNLSCHRLNMALRVICQDEMGKSAISENLTRIKLRNAHGKDAMRIAFQAGTLEIDCAYAMGASGMYNDNEIRQTLEQGL